MGSMLWAVLEVLVRLIQYIDSRAIIMKHIVESEYLHIVEREYLHIVESEYLHIVEREYLHILEREFRSIYEMCSATEHKVYREKKGKKVCREGKKICKSVNKVRKKKKDLKNSYSAKEKNSFYENNPFITLPYRKPPK